MTLLRISEARDQRNRLGTRVYKVSGGEKKTKHRFEGRVRGHLAEVQRNRILVSV